MEGKAKVISHAKFLRIPSNAQLDEISFVEHILEAYCTGTDRAQKKKKAVLTDSALVLYELQGDSYQPTLIKELTDDLRFKRISALSDEKSKTPFTEGFSLINQKGKTTFFYFQFSNLAELWVNYLAKVMVEVDFHCQYQVLAKVGSGSTASVCSVRRLSDGQIFAAKIFPKSYLEKGDRKQILNQEIELLRALQHQNILKIYGVVQSDTSVYIITEHCFGGNLLERINFCRGLSLEQIRQIMRGLMEGLAYLHKFGVMHRDIKLENVMLRSLDSWDPVLIDFGLAAVSDDEPYFHYRCGTPGYIAPEIIQMRGHKHTDVVCDVFSAGCVFHILLTNSYLFTGSNSKQIYEANKSLSFDLSREKYKNIDKSALDLLQAMLELNHEERISAEQCLEMPFLSGCAAIREKQEVSPTVTDVGSFDISYQF